MSLSAGLVDFLQKHGYRPIEKIGKGGFCLVLSVFSEKYQMMFAAKVFPIISNPRLKVVFATEVEIVRGLDHPGIIKIYDQFANEEYGIIVMELCRNGSLANFIKKNGKRLERSEVASFFYSICSAVAYCHHRGLDHMDIKPQNILLDANNHIRLIDFGLSIQCLPGVKIRRSSGTLEYIAPELLGIHAIDPYKADIWSLGVTLHVMAEGHVPWISRNSDNLRKEIKGGYITLWPCDDKSWIDGMIRKLLSFDPLKRPKIDNVINETKSHIIKAKRGCQIARTSISYSLVIDQIFFYSHKRQVILHSKDKS